MYPNNRVSHCTITYLPRFLLNVSSDPDEVLLTVMARKVANSYNSTGSPFHQVRRRTIFPKI